MIQASDGNLYGTTPVGGSRGAGTVFRISNPSTSPVESVIYSFKGGTDGSYPLASLIQASDGNLYGTTNSGGLNDCRLVSGFMVSIVPCGTVFRISDLSGTPTGSVIYTFTGQADGGNPTAALIQASDGNLYGTTTVGGSGDAGTVFKISNLETSPTFSVIHDFTGGGDGGSPTASLIQASDANLYGTANRGGGSECPRGCGVIFKISNLATSPFASVVYSFTGGSDGESPGTALTQASDGNLYGTTAGGGSHQRGTVFRIGNLSGAPTESVIYAFTGGTDGDRPEAALIQASDGNLYGTTASGGSGTCVDQNDLPVGCGTVFKIGSPTTRTSPTESVIHSFDGMDGEGPRAPLIQASDGNFYGTTESGGSSSSGTVFKIGNPMTLPTENVIYDFAGTDGEFPLHALIQTSDGSLFGTTASGGALGNGAGTVFKITDPTTAPAESVIYSFTGRSDGGNPSGLIQASDGNLYGTTSSGGSCLECGTIFKISNPTTSPAFSVIYSFTGGSDGGVPVASLVQASDGNLYGVTYFGGSNNAGTVFRISHLTTSPIFAVIHRFDEASEGSSPLASLIQASDGNLYGTTPNGGSNNSGAIFRIGNLETVPTFSVIHLFKGGSDGAGPLAALMQASDGNFYGTTCCGGSSNAGTVFKINDPTTSPVESVIYSFQGGSGGASPWASLFQASDGNLYGTTTTGGSGSDLLAGCGTVFQIGNPATSPSESVIYRFTGGVDGAFPEASLIQASDGRLYGTTQGGAAGAGVVFSIELPPRVSPAPPARPVPIHGRSADGGSR